MLFAAVGALHLGLALAFVKVGTHVRTVDVVSIEARFVASERPVETTPTLEIDHSIPTMKLNIAAVRPSVEIAAEAVAPAALPRQSSRPASTNAIAPVATPITIEAVEYMTAPSPRYPALSKKLRESGTVVLKVLVDERGGAANIEVADSSGFERLDKAAVEAVAGATFRPYVENGAARAVFVLIPIEFGLKRARG